MLFSFFSFEFWPIMLATKGILTSPTHSRRNSDQSHKPSKLLFLFSLPLTFSNKFLCSHFTEYKQICHLTLSDPAWDEAFKQILHYNFCSNFAVIKKTWDLNLYEPGQNKVVTEEEWTNEWTNEVNVLMLMNMALIPASLIADRPLPGVCSACFPPQSWIYSGMRNS